MQKRDFIFAGLLAVSLLYNFFTWQEVKDIRQSQFNNYTNDYFHEFSTINEAIASLKQEQKWVQKSDFTLDKENSTSEKMHLQGEWHFNELESSQTPILLLREKDGTEWLEITLENSGLLTYAGKMELSPDVHYEYKLVAKGKITRSSELLDLPYELYGLPSWGTDFGYTGNDSDVTHLEFHLNFMHLAPIKDMQPAKANLNFLNDGKVIKRVPFEANEQSPENSYRLSMKIDSLSNLSFTEIHIEVEYKNGSKVTQPLDEVYYQDLNHLGIN